MNKLQKVDLHIHSPASSDYLGERSDKAYLDILRSCKKARVRAIAITDHNTVNGHIAVERLKKESRLNYELNSKRASSESLLDELREEMLLFEDVSILRAVEISVYPKLHIIIIFSDEVILDEVSEFLKRDLDLNEGVDKGSPDFYSPFSPEIVLDKLTERFSDNFFCILPHVDSSNGAWNELKGKPRSDIFKRPEVLAVQVISPDTKRHLLQNVLDTEDYRKAPKLSIIQASDYHGGEADEIARQYSVIEHDGRISFEELRKAFRSSQPIKISSDYIDENYKEAIAGKEIIKFEFKNGLIVQDNQKIDLSKALCAILNSTNSLIQMDVLNSSDSASKISQEIGSLLKGDLLNQLDPKIDFNLRISDLSHSPTRQRHLIEQEGNTRLRMFGGYVYHVIKNKCVLASAQDIEQIVSKNAYRRFGRNRQKSLSSTAERLLMIASSFPAIATAYRIDQLLDKSYIKDYDHSFEVPLNSQEISQSKNTLSDLGSADGEFILIRHRSKIIAGRYENHYLRFSVPTYSNKNIKFPEEHTFICPEKSLVITPVGALYYVEKEMPIYSQMPIYVLTPKKDSELTRADILGLCALWKSSFFVWCLITIHETSDMFQMAIQNIGRLPALKSKESLRSLAVHAERILASEKNFLKEFNRPKIEEKNIEKLVAKHNAESNKNMRIIDRDVFKALGFSEEEIREVYRSLNELEICDYGVSSEINDFVESVVKLI